MELIAYLDTHFLTRARLLDAAGIDAGRLDALIAQERMPHPSYRLKWDVTCTSYFGAHEDGARVDYFARGYVAWIGTLPAAPDDAFDVFARRYRAALAALPLRALDPRPDAGSDAHLRAEWRDFLAGTYGLCTRSGLPEDIAAKELATRVIDALTAARPPLAAADLATLRAATDLLDAASSPFAPHERARSSRRRLVDDVRAAYGLTASRSGG